MKIGDRVNVREDARAKLGQLEPSTAEILLAQGYLTVAHRWKLSCRESYWIVFVEVPDVAFPEISFMKWRK